MSDSAVFSVNNATLIFPQKHLHEYRIDLTGASQLMLNGATLVTNGTSNNNLTMVLNARGSSEVSVSNSTLDNARSWILGNFHDHSKLTANTTTNIPTEIYPEDSSQATIVNSTVSNIWLKFLPSSSANITLPSLDGDGKFSLAFGSSSGTNIAYQVHITNSKSALGFNSLPNSTLNLTGSGGTNPTVVIGYFIINNPSPMTVSGLAVGLVASKTLNDLGRTLSLKNVNLGEFGWQIYCQNNSGGLVTIKNSFVNELGGFQNSNIRVESSTLQLADLAAAAPTSQIVVDKSDIWSHSVQATNGGSLTIENSTIHGNLFTSSGCNAGHCSTITLTTHVTEANNGTQPTCLGANWLGNDNTPQAAANMFQPDGTPNCDPLNPLQAPSRFVTSNGGVINK
jgi:hypothetical protein